MSLESAFSLRRWFLEGAGLPQPPTQGARHSRLQTKGGRAGRSPVRPSHTQLGLTLPRRRREETSPRLTALRVSSYVRNMQPRSQPASSPLPSPHLPPSHVLSHVIPSHALTLTSHPLPHQSISVRVHRRHELGSAEPRFMCLLMCLDPG